MAIGIFGDGSFIGDPSTPNPINAFTQNGNAFGALGVLGTVDAFGLSVITSGTTRLAFGATGEATWSVDGTSHPRISYTSSLAGLTYNHVVSTVPNFGVDNHIEQRGWNIGGPAGQDNLLYPSQSLDLENGFQYGPAYYQRQNENHLPQSFITIASVTSSAKQTFNVNNGDTLVLSIDGGIDQTATVLPGDVTVGAATSDQLRIVIERDTTAKGAVNADGRLTVFKIPSATATADTIQIKASNIATACGLGLALHTGTLTNRRPISNTVNWFTTETAVGVVGSFTILDSTSTVIRMSIPDSTGDVTMFWGDPAASLSISALSKLDMTIAGTSSWQTVASGLTIVGGTTLSVQSGSGALTIGSGTSMGIATTNGSMTFDIGGGGGKGLIFKVGGAARYDVDVTTASTITIAAGIALACAGEMVLNGVSGISAKKNGALYFDVGVANASKVTLASGISLFSAGGVADLDFSGSSGAWKMPGGAGSWSATNGVSFTLSGGNQALLDINSGSGFKVRNGASDGWSTYQLGAHLWTIDGIGATTTLQFGNANVVNVDIHGALTQLAGGGNVSLPCQNNGTWLGGNTSGTASMTLDAGTGTVNAWTSASARTINVGTGNAIQTINLGTHATPVNVIGIGGAASTIGFYGHAKTALQTGVAVTAAGVHAALVNLGLITA